MKWFLWIVFGILFGSSMMGCASTRLRAAAQKKMVFDDAFTQGYCSRKVDEVLATGADVTERSIGGDCLSVFNNELSKTIYRSR